jgi:colanic acid biosynthesis glycosyl transferase WcaI
VKILLLNQFFWPDIAPTGQLLTDLARHLSAEGHQVTVVCAATQYGADISTEPEPAVRILRTGALPFARGKVARSLSYVSFLCGAAWKALSTGKHDLVVTLTTPPGLSVLGTILKLLRGSRHYIWEMDIYPDVAVDLGVMKAGSWAARFLGAVLDLTRAKADGIIALGECMQRRLITHGVPAGKIVIAHNWADGSAILPIPGRHDGLTVLYSGNLGLAHDVETISTAMNLLKEDDTVQFVFAGAGGRRKEIEDFCRREAIPNVSFLPYQTRRQWAENLNDADIGLVTQNERCCGSVVPSKVYALMAAGRPVLFIGPPNATPARIIDQFACGWRIRCGDSAAVVELLRRLSRSPELVRETSLRARTAFLENYDLPKGVSRVSEALGLAPAGLSRASASGTP